MSDLFCIQKGTNYWVFILPSSAPTSALAGLNFYPGKYQNDQIEQHLVKQSRLGQSLAKMLHFLLQYIKPMQERYLKLEATIIKILFLITGN